MTVMLSPATILAYLRTQRLTVEASVSVDGAAQAAVVGIAVTDRFEVVFDTLASTRKVPNLRANPRIALVIGGLLAGDERTVQYEGIADLPSGTELDRVRAAYFEAWPDGRDRVGWPGLVYIRVRATWLRYSDFNQDPPVIAELGAEDLIARA